VPEWGEEVRRCFCYWKGKQLGRAAEGRADSIRSAGGGGFCESGGRRRGRGVGLVGQAGWEASWPEREWATR
jgi:hypothetical protein